MKELTLLFIVGLTMVSAASLRSLEDTEPGMQTEDKKTALKMMLKYLLQNALEDKELAEDNAKDRELEMQAEEKEYDEKLAAEIAARDMELQMQAEEKEMEEMQAREIAAGDMELQMQAEDKRDALKMILKSLLENGMEEKEAARDRELYMLAQGEMQANDDTEMKRELEAEREEKEMEEMQAREIAARDMELQMQADDEAERKMEILKRLVAMLEE